MTNSTAMDSLTVARSLRGSIGMLAMAWLINDQTSAKAAERGLDAAGRGAYAVGRLGSALEPRRAMALQVLAGLVAIGVGVAWSALAWG